MVPATVYNLLFRSTDYNREPFNKQYFWALNRIPAPAGPGTVLDLGCGRGRLLRALTARGLTCTGVDYADALLESDWSGIEFLVADICWLRLGREFDYVICHDVLEHLEEPEIVQTLETIQAHLLPGGHLSIGVANHEDVHFLGELHLTKKPFPFWNELLREWFRIDQAESTSEDRLFLFWGGRRQ